MAVVGTARVIITADTSGLESSIRAALANIDFRGIGGEAGNNFTDGFDQSVQQRMQQVGQQHAQVYGDAVSSRVRDSTRDVGASIGSGGDSTARQRGRETGDAFGGSFMDAVERYGKNKKDAPFEGMITSLMDRIHEIAAQGIGMTAVAGGLFQIAQGIVAIGSSVGGAIPALGAFGNIFSALFQGMTVAKSAFKGVGEAVKALGTSTKGASAALGDAAERALQVAQAKLALKRATLAAGRAAEDETLAIQRAQRGYQDALDNEKKAQERVAEARKNAAEKIIDMKFALEDSVLSEERAVLNLKKAEKELAKARSGGNANAIYEADLAYREQELSLRKLRESNKRLGEDADKTFKEGVDGNEQVEDSLKAQERAVLAVSDALRNLNRTMQDAPLQTEATMLSLKQAQLALKKAMEPPKNTAVAAVDEAMSKLHPNAQWFAKFYTGTIKPFIEDMQKKGQGLFFEGFNQAVLKLWNSDFPDILEKAYTLTAFTMGNIANSIAGAFTAEPKMDGLKSNLDYLENILMSNVTILSSLGEGAKNLVSPLLQIGDSLAPIAKDMAAGFAEAARSFGDFVGEAKATGELDAFFQRSYDRLKNLWGAIKSFGTGFKEYFSLAAEGGDIFIKGLTEIGDRWSASFKDADKVELLRQSFANAAENALTLLEIIGNIAGAFSGLGADNSLGDLLEAVKELTETEAFSDALISGAGAFVGMLEKVVGALGPMLAAFAEMQTLEHFFTAVGFIAEIVGKVIGVLAGNPIGRVFLEATGYVVAFSLVVSLLVGIFLKLKKRWEDMQKAAKSLGDVGKAAKAKLTGGPAPESSGRAAGRQAGTDVSEGFEDGVRTGSAEIAQAARELANVFLNTFRAIFRMSSPSLVMFDAGVDIVKGLVLGIRTAGPEVQAALRGLFTGETGAAVASGQQLGDAQMEALQAAVTANTGENINAVRNALAGAAQVAVPAGTQAGTAFVDAAETRIRAGGVEMSSAAGTAARTAGQGMGIGGTVAGGKFVDAAETRIRAGGRELASAAATAARPAGDALAREGERGGREMVDGVDKGSKGIGGSMKKIGGAIGGVGLGIAGFLGPMLLFTLLGPQLEKIFASIMPALQGVIDTVMPFIDGLIATIVPVFQQLLAFIMPIFQQIFATVMPILQQIFDTVAPIIMNLINTIMPVFQQIFNTLAPIFQDLMGSLVPVIQMLLQALSPLIGMLVNALVPIFALLAAVIQALMPIIMTLITSVLSVFIEIIAAIIPIFVELVATLMPVFMDLITELTPIFAELMDAFMNLWTSLVSSLLPVLLDLIKIFVMLLPSLLAVVGVLISELLPVILELLPVFVDLIMMIAGALVPVIGTLAPVIGSLASTFISLLVPVIRFVISMIVPLITIFMKVVAAILTFVIPIIVKLVEIFAKVLIPIITNIINWIANLFTAIGNAWNTYGKPTIDFIAAAFAVLWNIIKIAIDIIIAYIRFWWNTILWIWENVGKPIFNFVAAAFEILWNVIKFAIDVIIAYYTFLWNTALWIWENVGKPIFKFVAAAFEILWNVIKFVIDIVIAYVKFWWNTILWIWENVGRPIFDALKAAFDGVKSFISGVIDFIIGLFNSWWNGLQSAWDRFGQPAIDALKSAFQGVKDFIGGVVDGIKERWNQIVEAIKGPVKTIVGGINDWLINPLNKVLSALGLSWRIDPINVNWGTTTSSAPARGPGVPMAAGGRVTGRGGSRDDKIPTLLSHGEYVINASSAKRLGLSNLNFLNNNGKFPMGGRSGGFLGIGMGGFLDTMVGAVSTFYDNTIGSVLNQVGDWIQEGIAIAIGKVLDFGINLADDYAGNPFGDFLLGVMETLKKKVQEWATKEEEKKEAELASQVAGGNVPPYDGPDDGWAYPLARRSTPTTYVGHRNPGARDFGAPEGTEIRAVASGRVITSADMGNRSYGQYIKLTHLGGIISLYAHMSKRIAEIGKNVKVGETIGLVGNTGNSRGPHLHLEVASPQDAADFLRRKGVKWLADGGVVRATEGGVAAILAEGGRSERVTPLDAEGRTPAEVELLTMMKQYLGKESLTVTNNIYPSAGMSERDLATRVSQEIVYLQRRRA